MDMDDLMDEKTRDAGTGLKDSGARQQPTVSDESHRGNFFGRMLRNANNAITIKYFEDGKEINDRDSHRRLLRYAKDMTKAGATTAFAGGMLLAASFMVGYGVTSQVMVISGVVVTVCGVPIATIGMANSEKYENIVKKER